jgi:acetylornithine deacetylase/succinyl-diaminopimelate desuccinylase-like protein
VTFEAHGAASGWNAPATVPWFEQAHERGLAGALRRTRGLHRPGRHHPAHEHAQRGFPKAQMMVCGVLGPKSNAHGPNEFLHVPYAKKLTAAVAQVIASLPA